MCAYVYIYIYICVYVFIIIIFIITISSRSSSSSSSSSSIIICFIIIIMFIKIPEVSIETLGESGIRRWSLQVGSQVLKEKEQKIKMARKENMKIESRP